MIPNLVKFFQIYPSAESAIDLNRLLHWVHYRSHSPIQWIWPSGRKNKVIQHYFVDDHQISLILFTSNVPHSLEAMMVKLPHFPLTIGRKYYIFNYFYNL